MNRLARVRTWLAAWCFIASGWAAAETDASYRVAIIGNSAPMSYVDASGRLTGVNVELARALCATIKAQCQLTMVPLAEVVPTVSRGDVDFAVVSLLITPERQRHVLFTKPYYRSLSAWVARPGLKPGTAQARVAVVQGSVQARYAEAQSWKTVGLTNHTQLADVVLAGRADAVLIPMLTAISFLQEKGIPQLGWGYTMLSEPQLAGDVGISVDPKHPELRDKLDAAIDQVKRDGRFDRITADFLPFKLQ